MSDEQLERIRKLEAEVERLKEQDQSWMQTVEKRESQITALTAERDELKKAIAENWRIPYVNYSECRFCRGVVTVKDSVEAKQHRPNCIVLRCQPKEVETK